MVTPLTIDGAAAAGQSRSGSGVGLDYIRRRLSPTGSHIILDAIEDVFRRTHPVVRPMADLSLWIDRRARSANPLIRGWYGPLVLGDGVARQSFSTADCGRCEAPLEVRRVGHDLREIRGDRVSYELTVRKFVGCNHCAYCLWRKKAALIEATCIEIDHALSRGDRVWWGTLTFTPARYADAVYRTGKAFEDNSETATPSIVARRFREGFAEHEELSFGKLQQDQQDRLVEEYLYDDVNAFFKRLATMEWSDGDYEIGVKAGFHRRLVTAHYRYLCAAEIASPESRARTLAKRGVDPAILGPGTRQIHFHIILVCWDQIITKRSLDRAWREFGGGVTSFELLKESDGKQRAEYLCKYACKSPLSRSYHSANWGVCVPRGTGAAVVKATKKARIADRLADRQAYRQDAVYLDAVRYDADERARRDAERTRRQDALVVEGSVIKDDAELARVRALAQRLSDHHDDTLDNEFVSDEPVLRLGEPEPEVVAAADFKDAIETVLNAPYQVPAKTALRRFLGERRRRRGRRR